MNFNLGQNHLQHSTLKRKLTLITLINSSIRTFNMG